MPISQSVLRISVMSNDPPILEYGKPEKRRSAVPLLGAISCALAAIFGIAICGFGVWNLIYSMRAGLSMTNSILTALAIFAIGISLFMLSVKWFRAARREQWAGRIKSRAS